MRKSRQKEIPKRKRRKQEDSTETVTPSSEISDSEKQQKLKALDDFMEGVLQKAGEEFLDEFKQVEGE
jgi:hypothetical protein